MGRPPSFTVQGGEEIGPDVRGGEGACDGDERAFQAGAFGEPVDEGRHWPTVSSRCPPPPPGRAQHNVGAPDMLQRAGAIGGDCLDLLGSPPNGNPLEFAEPGAFRRLDRSFEGGHP